ncbi:DeoR family transcriptional regulator, partial [Neorhizobium galegae]|nr:DeoR family transcriptional regulator [Neorhizobium galegae]
TAPVRIGQISQVQTFITDDCTSPSIREICLQNGVALVETSKTNAEVH